MQLENPSNYQHTLQLLGVLKDAALNGIPWCPYTFARNIIIIVFFLDHITKLFMLTLVVMGWGGGVHCARSRFFCLSWEHQGSWESPWQSQKSPWWKGSSWKLLIIQFLLVPSSLSCKFNSALPLNYISEKCFRVISFTLANSSIWSVKKTESHN